MKDEVKAVSLHFILHPSSFILPVPREASTRGAVVVSERNFVVLDLRLLRATAAARRAARRGGCRLLRLPDGDAFNVGGAVEELHVRGVDLQSVTLLAVAVCPLLHVEAALDVDAPPLRQILRDVLGLPAPRVDAEPGRHVSKYLSK